MDKKTLFNFAFTITFISGKKTTIFNHYNNNEYGKCLKYNVSLFIKFIQLTKSSIIRILNIFEFEGIVCTN